MIYVLGPKNKKKIEELKNKGNIIENYNIN